jgi:outer membrane protein, heavy metal efflux system
MPPIRRTSWLAAVLLLVGCRSYAPQPLDAEGAAAAFDARSLASREVTARVEHLLGASEAPARWDAAALTAAALGFRSGIGLARAQAQRASASITTAGARPNPTLSLTPEISSNAAAASSPWSPMLSISWPIETAGKRGHRIDQARAQALSARYALFGEVVRTHAEIARALADRDAAARSAASLAQQRDAADALAEHWRNRVAQGVASRVEAAPLEAARLDALRALEAQRRAEVEATNAAAAAVGVPARELTGAALRPPDAAELAPFASVDRRGALERALLSRSDVLAALADYAAAEAALALEVAKQYPNLNIGPGYQFDQGQNKWQIGVSLELPLLDRNEGPIAEAEAARSEAAARFDAVQAGAIAAVESALARRDGFAAERVTLRELADQREQSVARAERQLALGAASRVDVLAARLDALRAEQADVDADAAWRDALLDLAAALEALPFPTERLEAWMDEDETP